jgi:hypothetical protein
MTIGGSLLLVAIGAILKWAVTATVSGVDLHTVGTIVLVVGLAGFVVSLLYTLWWARRDAVVVQDARARQVVPPPDPPPDL